MSEQSKRLLEVILNSQLSYVELEKKTGIAKSSIQRYASGITKKIPIDAVKAIADATESSAAWIMGWEDENANNKEHGLTNEDLYKYGIKPIKKRKFRMLGNIACGEPIFADQDYETYVEASSDINADFCVTAKGDSMINARIFDGDIIFIHSQPDVDNGEIAAVIIEDTVTLKRVYKYPDRLELRPENPMHRVQNYEGEELNQIRILGKAVAFQSYVR